MLDVYLTCLKFKSNCSRFNSNSTDVLTPSQNFQMFICQDFYMFLSQKFQMFLCQNNFKNKKIDMSINILNLNSQFKERLVIT